MPFPYQHADAAGANVLVLNYTFWIPDHTNLFRWGQQPIPRAHGDRAQDVAYLSSKQVVLRGFIGNGYGQYGSVPFGWVLKHPADSELAVMCSETEDVLTLLDASGFAESGRTIFDNGEVVYYTGKFGNTLLSCQRGMEGTTATEHDAGDDVTAPSLDAQYFDSIRSTLAHFHTYSRGILDLRNGWVYYVLTENVKDSQVEGWPDTRAIDITLRLEDPFAYSLQSMHGMIENTDSISQLHVLLHGNADSRHYRLRVRSATPSEVRVKIQNGTDTPMTLLVPGAADTPLVLNGFQRMLFQDSIAEPTWSRFLQTREDGDVIGSVMPMLRPGLNSWTFTHDGENDDDLPKKLIAFVETTLAEALDDSEVQIDLADASDFPDPAVVAWATIGGTEFIQYTGKTGNTLTGVTRAADATAHANGTAIIFAGELPSGVQPIQVELVAHAADWLGDSYRVPQNLPPGEYDLAQYDLAVYG